MKRLFILMAVLSAVCVQAGAQSLDYITFRSADGTERSVSIDGLRITFADGQLSATNNEESFSTPLSALSTMFFAEAPTAIRAVATADAHLSYSNGQLSVSAPQGEIVSVYGADGRLVLQHVKHADGEERIPLSVLRGVYVIKMNGETTKLMVR